jgi:hypothetical protein
VCRVGDVGDDQYEGDLPAKDGDEDDCFEILVVVGEGGGGRRDLNRGGG